MRHVIIIASLIALTGCASTSKTYEFDQKTGKVLRVHETSVSLVGQIIESTKNKTCFAYSNGWVGMMSVSPGTSENPTPHFVAKAAFMDHGILTLHKEQKNLSGVAQVVNACINKELSLTKSGISAAGGAATSEKD